MKLEKILSFDDFRPVTTGGRRECAGFREMRIGDWLWVHDGVVMGYQQQSGLPIMPVAPEIGDGLLMLRFYNARLGEGSMDLTRFELALTDYDFNDVEVKEVIPPSVEYKPWFFTYGPQNYAIVWAPIQGDQNEIIDLPMVLETNGSRSNFDNWYVGWYVDYLDVDAYMDGAVLMWAVGNGQYIDYWKDGENLRWVEFTAPQPVYPVIPAPNWIESWQRTKTINNHISHGGIFHPAFTQLSIETTVMAWPNSVPEDINWFIRAPESRYGYDGFYPDGMARWWYPGYYDMQTDAEPPATFDPSGDDYTLTSDANVYQDKYDLWGGRISFYSDITADSRALIRLERICDANGGSYVAYYQIDGSATASKTVWVNEGGNTELMRDAYQAGWGWTGEYGAELVVGVDSFDGSNNSETQTISVGYFDGYMSGGNGNSARVQIVIDDQTKITFPRPGDEPDVVTLTYTGNDYSFQIFPQSGYHDRIIQSPVCGSNDTGAWMLTSNWERIDSYFEPNIPGTGFVWMKLVGGNVIRGTLPFRTFNKRIGPWKKSMP
jgi:hypothetical protein